MPSALETLVKILKLEREQGCNDTAVIGGLAAFSQNWMNDARKQARKPEHHLLLDELVILMQKYDQLENRNERSARIQYMMDRIMGRVPPPPEYRAPVVSPQPPEIQEPAKADARPVESRRPEPPPREREQREQRSRNAPPPKAQARQNQPQPRKPRHENPRGERSAYDDRQDSFSEDRYIGSKGNGFRPTGQLDIAPIPTLARPPRAARRALEAEEAADILRGLNAPVAVVKGVGDRMVGSFERLDVRTIKDLLYFFPRRYDDYTRLLSVNRLQPNETAVVIGTVREAAVKVGRGPRKDLHVVLDDGAGLLLVVFFGQHYLSRDIKPEDQLVVRGETSLFSGRIQMTNPEWEHLDSENLVKTGIVPVYPLTRNLKARGLRRIMKTAVEYWAERLPDYMPEATLERAELADLGWSLKNLHFPEGWDHLEHARRRVVFDELLLRQLALLGKRREWQAEPAQPLHIADEFIESFVQAVFPYDLTGAQRRAIEDIRGDVGKNVPMNRLLQGDVGSGKTAVAATALAMAVANGRQGAIMAPTSILAEQHFRNLTRTFSQMPGERQPVVALLTAAVTGAERDAVYSGLIDGSVDVVVGTHALIQEGLGFKDLALAVIDEQHRFGVEQRGALRGKAANPHLLVMTATPIPRTLALTIYADLDLSIIDEMPPGRIPVKTRIVEPVARERVVNFVEGQLEQGRQAFLVHPLVEQSDKIDAASAIEAYERLSKVFYRYKVGLLHGRMKAAEKDAVMEDFSSGALQVLVTTSVAEVGVDVPNASVMVIEGANRFGLAQLHQFRGRVGRGEHASFCLLVPDNNSDEALERLKVMEDTTDGFRLAEMDWKLRGAGDLIGTRQSGRDDLQMAAFITVDLVELAQREARTIYEEDPDLIHPEHRLLAQRVQMLWDERSDVS